MHWPVSAAADVGAEIDAAVRQLAAHSGARFAVALAVDEDGAESSFAGQLASYLFVDAESVALRVADVWRSGFSERIFEYRRLRGMPAAPACAPAVLVQRMIDAAASGVAFSADPVSGRRGLAVVSAVNGIGTALVGGEADADVYEVDQPGESNGRPLRTSSFGTVSTPKRRKALAHNRCRQTKWTGRRSQMHKRQRLLPWRGARQWNSANRRT